MATFPWRIFKALSSIFYLFLIIITIPLAFDVGGEECGIAFTGTLSLFYLVLSTLRILARNTPFRFLTSIFYHLQHIIIPSLLILHLSIFSSPTTTNDSAIESLQQNQHLLSTTAAFASQDWVVKICVICLEPWKWFIKNATPLFTTMEGFCSLLVIQTAGRVSTWLVRRHSDSWIIPQLLFSSCAFSTSLYFLYRIYTFPVTISLASATLIGVVLTITGFLAIYGIVTRTGNSIESSLLVSYIVYCLYFTFTDFQSSISASTFLYFFSSSTRNDIPPLPPIIVSGYSNLASLTASLVPASFKTVFQFLRGAVSTVTPSVFVSLSYRLAVFFAATRIIPAIHKLSLNSSASSPSISRSQSHVSVSNQQESSDKLTPQDSNKSNNGLSSNDEYNSKNSNSTSVNGGENRSRKGSIRSSQPAINNPDDGSVSTNSRIRKIIKKKLEESDNRYITTDDDEDYDDDCIIINDLDYGLEGELELYDSSNKDDDEKTVISTATTSFSKAIKDNDDTIEEIKSAKLINKTATSSSDDDITPVLSTSSALSSSTTIASSSTPLSQTDDGQEPLIGDYDEKSQQTPQSKTDEFNDNPNNDKNNNANDSFSENKTDQKPNGTTTTKYESKDSSSKETTISHSGSNNDPLNSNGLTVQFLILSYAPCILIAVYTHLLIQHLAIFNTISNDKRGELGVDGQLDNSPSPSKMDINTVMKNCISNTCVSLASTIISSSYSSYVTSSASDSSLSARNLVKSGLNATASLIKSVNGTLTNKTSEEEALLNGSESSIKDKIVQMLINVWMWSRSWVATPRDSWQFWGWVNMFSTLFLYALELLYGKDQDIIDYNHNWELNSN